MVAAGARDRSLRLPPRGGLARVAFVGQTTYFAPCALDPGHPTLRSRFFEFRAGGSAEELRAKLDAFAPHAVVVFRPETIPPALFAGLSAATLGFLTEPVPRKPGRAHPDLQIRLQELHRADPGNFDRVVSFDPLIVPTSERAGLPVWRSLPLPVADRFFAPSRRIRGRPRVFFGGRGTEHRKRLLDPLQERFDVLQVSFGFVDEAFAGLMRRHDVGINLHNEPYPTFENRVSLYLAAGLLVLTEPLSPTHGLEPGIDYLEASTSWELITHVQRLLDSPGVCDDVAMRGRRKAEMFRASRVYPRLLADLWADLAARGRTRP